VYIVDRSITEHTAGSMRAGLRVLPRPPARPSTCMQAPRPRVTGTDKNAPRQPPGRSQFMSETVATGFATSDAGKLAAVRRRAILSCAVGNFFELFDFTIYGYFAVAITRAFYPSGSMYGTYAAFGAAFLMRPVGAIVIGAYGDRMGRRAAL